MSKIERIIKAKLSKKENMPDYYYERLSKCYLCPYNSKNKENLSLVDKIRISHNLGKDSCLICTCGVEDKASDPVEQCPDNPPRWTAQEPEKGKAILLTLGKGKAEFGFDKEMNSYVLDYKDVTRGADTGVEIFYTEDDITGMNVQTSCGCTTSSAFKGKITIQYDSSRMGPIDKNVRLSYNRGKVREFTNIKLKGRIYEL